MDNIPMSLQSMAACVSARMFVATKKKVRCDQDAYYTEWLSCDPVITGYTQ
jgi:hypothetical protein